jgi:hypothetical protein
VVQIPTTFAGEFCLANDRVLKNDDEKVAWNKINRTAFNRIFIVIQKNEVQK